MTQEIKEHLHKFSYEELTKEMNNVNSTTLFKSNGIFSIDVSKSLMCTQNEADLLCNIYEAIVTKWTGAENDTHIGIGAWIKTIRQAVLAIVVAAIGMQKVGHRYRAYTHNNSNPYALVVCDATGKHFVQFQTKIYQGKERLKSKRLKEQVLQDFNSISYGSVLVRRKGQKDAYAEVIQSIISVQVGNKVNKKMAKKQLHKACGLHSCSEPATKTCARCKTIAYCSQDCAKANWNTHKKYCCPLLPKDVSLDFAGYENIYEEPLLNMNGTEMKLKLPIPALAYFDQLSEKIIVLEQFKQQEKKWRKIKQFKIKVAGVELTHNVEKDIIFIRQACTWFYQHFNKKAAILCIPIDYPE